ncbi:MAG: undecaprenyl/decaprenyl-phosphate alpha-N-acetylglucosaminyl 1-phosphate transferase [Candidatus Eremiobacteraeota bacterium]|nr:undecaprenyl/decaprenyl-phosphate alpha-N-acetylglucosaminyl 1-phosphate transferase [Candidatus Eremiobacteraeota bacterium]MCW5868635.1 undecaprenyl/decaprenyl-phosphate alpha-N-acetylglucosaminyl 1-phosphate transferase [Candidatus Eremiobacteraeota bacterium]
MHATISLVAFTLGCLGTLGITPLVKRIATAAGAIDRPNARKVHKVPTPLWGGLGVFLSLSVAILATLKIFSADIAMTATNWSNLTGMLLGSLMIVLTGMWDDRYNMPAKVKLICQIGTALVMCKFGIRIGFVTGLGSDYFFFSEWQEWVLTIFWIVGITNAINLLDGLDGLVAGVALGSSLVFGFVSALQGQWMVMLVMAAIAGCCLGFLRYNFNPATIFMGDTGSLLLGLNFAGWSIVGAIKVTLSLTLVIPILIMAVPIFDTAFAIVRRGLARRPIFSPDKEHLHHRLLGLGMSQRQAVVLIYGINMAFGLAGLALAYVVH